MAGKWLVAAQPLGKNLIYTGEKIGAWVFNEGLKKNQERLAKLPKKQERSKAESRVGKLKELWTLQCILAYLQLWECVQNMQVRQCCLYVWQCWNKLNILWLHHMPAKFACFKHAHVRNSVSQLGFASCREYQQRERYTPLTIRLQCIVSFWQLPGDICWSDVTNKATVEKCTWPGLGKSFSWEWIRWSTSSFAEAYPWLYKSFDLTNRVPSCAYTSRSTADKNLYKLTLTQLQ